MEIAELLDFSPIQLRILIYVVVSMLLGAVVGLDRELADKPAGLRTHMLVAGSATLLVSLGQIIVREYDINSEILRSDPIRIIEAIITGVSFLGAGTIIRRGVGKVQGLTTAATLLFVASVGICVALSKLLLAVGVTVIALLTLRGVVFVERRLGFGPKSSDD
ncbi:MAG: MgtC/SapB family protein [Deltaproteobacteria bacterium]